MLIFIILLVQIKILNLVGCNIELLQDIVLFMNRSFIYDVVYTGVCFSFEFYSNHNLFEIYLMV